MLPRTIVSVLDSSDVVKDVAIAWALSLARWYESDLHVVHVRRSGRGTAAVESARRNELVERITRIAEASGTSGVNVIPAVLSGRPVRAIATYSRRVVAATGWLGRLPLRLVRPWLRRRSCFPSVCRRQLDRVSPFGTLSARSTSRKPRFVRSLKR